MDSVIQTEKITKLFGILFGALGLFAGAWTGKPGVAIGVGGAVGIIGFVANSFGPIVDGLEWAKYASPFYYLIGGNPMLNGLSIAHAFVLIGTTLALLAAGCYLFERRDLAV